MFLNGKISDQLAFDFSLIEFDYFTCRLSMNYRRDEQNFISLQEKLDDYVNNCSEKENFPLQVKELGIILCEAFPPASRVQRRVYGGRVWQYPLSKTSRLEEDPVKWEDLPAFTKEFHWLLSSSSDDFFEWIKVQSQDLCEGNRVLTEVKIFKDWTFVVHVNSRKVAKETVGVFELGASKKAVLYLFHVLNRFRLCKGFSVVAKLTAKDARGNTVGTTEEWRSRDASTVALYLRSTQCHVLLQEYKRSSSQLCESCSKVKRNCSATAVVEGEKPAAKKRVSYMSEKELREKLSREQNRRKNAERRLDYLRKKVEEEMKTFQGEDHKDFLHIFHSVEKESLSEDMKVFWEAQEKALLQTSSKGYRWHPKLVAFIRLIKKLIDRKE